nr:MAG: hypothetical protein DIU78_14020 [Pseudomonadota bacterium]
MGGAPNGGSPSSGGTSSGGMPATGGTAGEAGGTAGRGGAGGTAGSAGTGDDTGNAGSAGNGGGGNDGGARIAIEGRRLLVDGKPFHIRGVCWNPVPRGGVHPDDLDYAAFAPTDIPLMKGAHVNAVRTYEPLLDRSVLDRLHEAGIFVLNSVYVWGGAPTSVVTERVNAVKDHPAILMWVLGNEWNYNGLYVDLSHADALARLNEAAALVRAADPDRPIASVYGELPTTATIEAMPEIDIWGINAYRGISFGNLFQDFAARSDKPMFLAEYGADAYNASPGVSAYDPESQAMAVRALTRELVEASAAANASGVTIGGTLFEWADEWWKDGSGSPNMHDVGGIAPGGGPYPDQTFNEEWWGVVDIDRNPRPAYDALREELAALVEP